MIDIGNAKGLIFDCDGTLVDSMPLHMNAWKHAFLAVNKNNGKSPMGVVSGSIQDIVLKKR